MKKNLFTVYSQNLAGYLMTKGFPLIEMVKNKKTGMNNFVFANVPLLREYIDKWQCEKLTDRT